MANNPADLIRISTGVAENMTEQGACIVETTQIIGQCNEHIYTVLVLGVVIGMLACAVGVLIGAWYRGRQNKHE